MMTHKWFWAAIAVSGVGFHLAAGLVQGQQDGGRRGGIAGRSGVVALAGNEAVQKELALSDESAEKLKGVVEEYSVEARSQLQSLGGTLQNASNEERQQIFAKMQEASQKLNAKYVPKLKEALKPEQFTRLQQISWQAGGATIYSDPELVKALELSPDQQQKIGAVNQDYQQKQRELFNAAGGNFQEAFTKMRELSQDRDQKADEVLTMEQRDKLRELKGKPFDLSQLRSGRPGGNG